MYSVVGRAVNEMCGEGVGVGTYEESSGVPEIGIDLEDVGVAGRVEVKEIARKVALERVLCVHVSTIRTSPFSEHKGNLP